MADPTGSGQFAIGFGDDSSLDQVDAALDRIDRDIQDFLSIKLGVDADISSHIDLAIRENQDLTSTVNGIIAGRVDRAIEEMANITNRIDSRAQNQIDRRIELLAAYVSNLLENVEPPIEVSRLIGSASSQRATDADLAGLPIEGDLENAAIDMPRQCPPGFHASKASGQWTCIRDQPVIVPDDQPIVGPSLGGSGDGFPFDGSSSGLGTGTITVDDKTQPSVCSGQFTSLAECQSYLNSKGLKGFCYQVALTNTWRISNCSPVSGSPGQSSPGTCPATPAATCCPPDQAEKPSFKWPGCKSQLPDPLPGKLDLQINQALLTPGPASEFGVVNVADQPPLPGNANDVGFDRPPILEQHDFNARPDAVGEWSYGCAEPVTQEDYTFLAECGPDNWQEAKAAFDKVNTNAQNLVKTVSNQIGQTIADAADQVEVPFTFGIASALKWAFTFLLTTMVTAFGIIVFIVTSIMPKPKSCNNDSFYALVGQRAFWAFADRWTWCVPPTLMNSLNQAINYTCQTEIPSTQELTLQRMVGVVSKDQWDYGLKLNGCCPAWFEKSYEAGLLIPSVAQVFALHRGGFIDDEKFNYWLKRNRMPENGDKDFWDKLTQSLPGPAELMRMMVRDVEDQSVVDENNLDHLFDEKWTGTLRDWGLRQGLTDQVARYDWRSHWQTVSNTALLQMYYRLRAGEPISTFGGEDISVDEAWLEKQLLINDMIPGQAKRFIATSRPVFAVTYLRMLYVTGVLTEDELIPRFQDIGYTLDDARKFAKGLAKSQNQLKARYNGLYEPQRARNDFIKNLINESTYRVVLLDAGYLGDEVEQRVKSAKLEQKALANKGLLSQAKSAFFRGRLSEDEYRNVLQEIGLEGEQLETVFVRNRAEREWKYTEISIRRMCGLVKTGHLSVQEYVRRAKNLGFREKDAILQASGCVTEIQEQQQRRIAAELKAALQKAAKQERAEKRIKSSECKLLQKQQRAAANPTEANISAAQLQECENISAGS